MGNLKSISWLFLLPLAIITLGLTVIVARSVSIADKILLPGSRDFNYEYYTDWANEGNSRVLTFTATDSLVRLDFKLMEGFHSPYVGLSIIPENLPYVDVSRYNLLKIRVAGHGIDRVGIGLFAPPGNTSIDIKPGESIFHSFLNISAKPETYSIPIEQFRFPEWLADLHRLPVGSEGKPDLTRLRNLNINTAFVHKIGTIKTLEIYSVTLSRCNKELWLTAGSVYTTVLISFLGLAYWNNSKRKNETRLTITYLPINVSGANEIEDGCISFINNNYSNPELSVELISRATGVSGRRLAAVIRDKYECNFKTYLNRVRIHESKRLLSITNLGIGEIAYRVGFNNQSHFNRVFKFETGLNPSEFRENIESRTL